jgi:hypothetical protein
MFPRKPGQAAFYELVNFDELVKTLKMALFVIPAEAGIQRY